MWMIARGPALESAGPALFDLAILRRL
jgi:hypothetical protein